MNEEVCSDARAAPVCQTTYEQECSTQMVMEMQTVQEQKCDSVPEQVGQQNTVVPMNGDTTLMFRFAKL